DVRASMGHVGDLPKSEMGVEVDDGFKPHYEVVETRRKTINELRSAAKMDQEVILASDPDREGEAIAWHLAEVLRLRDPKRIEFHEITSDAVRRALESPREIDMRLVNAQQARRVVDRLVGFRLSPFLAAKVQKGIGAARVSSLALRPACGRLPPCAWPSSSTKVWSSAPKARPVSSLTCARTRPGSQPTPTRR